MAVERPGLTDSDERIVKFRPRTLAKPRPESGPASPDEYRHRMITNLAAIIFTAVLTGTGIWLAMKLADLRNTQDCVLMGRRDCAHISSLKE